MDQPTPTVLLPVSGEEQDEEDVAALVQLLNRKKTRRHKRKQKLKQGIPREKVIGFLAMLTWLTLASTFYYHKRQMNPFQSFFYTIDTGFSVGFGALIEGSWRSDGSVEPDNGSMAFTVFHTLIGSVGLGLGLAYFVLVALESHERLKLENENNDDNNNDNNDNNSSNSNNNSNNNETQLTKQQRIQRWITNHKRQTTILTLNVIWLFGGALIASAVNPNWSAIQALTFSMTAMGTSGLQPPYPNKESQMAFGAIFTLTGVPLFALLTGEAANLLTEWWEEDRQKEVLQERIENFQEEYFSELEKTEGVDFSQFTIMTLLQLGKLDSKLLEDIRGRFAFLDVDGDGSFSREEMVAMAEFERYDADGSGELDLVEFAIVVEEINSNNRKSPLSPRQGQGFIDSSPQNIVKEFRRLDTSGDGLIDKVEFMNWFRERRGGERVVARVQRSPVYSSSDMQKIVKAQKRYRAKSSPQQEKTSKRRQAREDKQEKTSKSRKQSREGERQSREGERQSRPRVLLSAEGYLELSQKQSPKHSKKRRHSTSRGDKNSHKPPDKPQVPFDLYPSGFPHLARTVTTEDIEKGTELESNGVSLS